MMKASSRASVSAGVKSEEARSMSGSSSGALLAGENQMLQGSRAHRLNRTGEFRRRDGDDGVAVERIFSTSCSRSRKLDGITTAPSFQGTQYRDHRMEIRPEPQHHAVAAVYAEATQDVGETIR